MITLENLVNAEIGQDLVITKVIKYLQKNPDKFFNSKELSLQLKNHRDTILEETSKNIDLLKKADIYRVKIKNQVYIGKIKNEEMKKKILELLK
jgi:hypothetical protein